MPNDDKQQFQEFEHTGDLGVELTVPTRVELFRRAAIALAALLVEKDTVAAIEERKLTVAGDGDADLMHDVLRTFCSRSMVSSGATRRSARLAAVL